jgi:hypothetical protein
MAPITGVVAAPGTQPGARKLRIAERARQSIKRVFRMGIGFPLLIAETPTSPSTGDAVSWVRPRGRAERSESAACAPRPLAGDAAFDPAMLSPSRWRSNASLR